MIEIKVPCSFAAYNLDAKVLESSIITIGEKTSICYFGDELKDPNKHVIFCETCDKLITDLTTLGIKNSDNSVITKPV